MIHILLSISIFFSTITFYMTGRDFKEDRKASINPILIILWWFIMSISWGIYSYYYGKEI